MESVLAQSNFLQMLSRVMAEVTPEAITRSNEQLGPATENDEVLGILEGEEEWLRALWVVIARSDALQDQYLAQAKLADGDEAEAALIQKAHVIGHCHRMALDLFWGEINIKYPPHREKQRGVRQDWKVINVAPEPSPFQLGGVLARISADGEVDFGGHIPPELAEVIKHDLAERFGDKFQKKSRGKREKKEIVN